jgi:predicted nucleic acid-binding protein
MSYLLDVSTLLAKLWKTHLFHTRVDVWMTGQSLAVCPITELGFVRISVAAYGADLDKAQEMLSDFLTQYKPQFVPCDIRALDGVKARSGKQTTDYYLANLADHHGLKWATLDETVNHKAAFVIPFPIPAHGQ